MGCIFSRSNRVAPEPEAQEMEQEEDAEAEEKDDDDKSISAENKNDPTPDADRESNREETNEDNPGYIITEYSYQFQVDKVVNNFEEKEDLDLTIIGKACLTSWKECEKRRKRKEEEKIIESLRQEGLISCPEVQTGCGISYDIVETGASFTDDRVRYPPRLAKLELSKENRKVQTQEDINKKLENAEKRRKEKEEEFVVKMKRETRDKLDSGAERVAERIKKREELQVRKMEAVEEKREKKMAETRERLKEREEYRQRVKRMKDISLDDLDPT